MSAHHWVRDAGGTLVEITDRILREGWTVKEAAEEGKTPTTQVAIADPAMDFDIVAHRLYLITEDESESPDDVLFAGFTADQEISRGWGEDGHPNGRLWVVTLTDANAVWARRVMVGADCKRPAETDVERMAWLLSTAEADMFDNVTDFVSSASPVAMDKVNYRGQMFNQIADDCAQASGKNWSTWYRLNEATSDRELTAWYGDESLTAYASTLFLSNDPSRWTDDELEDGTSLVWPISDDTKEHRSGSRVYAGIYLPYERGATYRWSGATATAFAKRDAVMPTLNVKSKAKAIARAIRYLATFATQDLRVTTTVELPAAKATLIRAGMRIPFEATHLPDYAGGDFHWTRILECTPEPVAAGDRYRLALELSSPGPAAPTCSAALAAAVADTAIGLESPAATASVSVTATGEGYVVGILMADNGNTPSATAMGTPSGYTTFDARDFSRATWFMGYKAASAGSVGMTASWTPGFASSGVWAAGAVWLPWAGLTVVQEDTSDPGAGGGDMVLPGTPTPGNTILMFATAQDLDAITFILGGTYGPSTGWTELFSATTVVSGINSRAHIACWARCVQAGDGVDYGFSYVDLIPAQAFGYVVEIATS